MSTKRVKGIVVKYDDGLDDDDDLDYDDESEDAGTEEISEEEKEQLRLGTIEVRTSLGSAHSSIPEKEIHDALWHYYYDVAKSVTYLKSTWPRSWLW